MNGFKLNKLLWMVDILELYYDLSIDFHFSIQYEMKKYFMEIKSPPIPKKIQDASQTVSIETL